MNHLTVPQGREARAELIATRKVPEDMIQRLQARLNIHRDHERGLEQSSVV